jgi:hypothetical protein
MTLETDTSGETIADPAELIPQKWRGQFREYLATGSGSPEFFAFLDTDAAGQEAVEAALAQRAAAFDRFTTELKRVFQAPDETEAGPSQAIAPDVAAVASLPREKRSELVDDIVDAANHLSANARRNVRDFFRDVSHRLQ